LFSQNQGGIESSATFQVDDDEGALSCTVFLDPPDYKVSLLKVGHIHPYGTFKNSDGRHSSLGRIERLWTVNYTNGQFFGEIKINRIKANPYYLEKFLREFSQPDNNCLLI